MDPKDIDISLSDAMLTIKGEKKEEKEEKEAGYHLVERSYGSFSGRFAFPQKFRATRSTPLTRTGS